MFKLSKEILKEQNKIVDFLNDSERGMKKWLPLIEAYDTINKNEHGELERYGDKMPDMKRVFDDAEKYTSDYMILYNAQDVFNDEIRAFWKEMNFILSVFNKTPMVEVMNSLNEFHDVNYPPLKTRLEKHTEIKRELYFRYEDLNKQMLKMKPDLIDDTTSL